MIDLEKLAQIMGTRKVSVSVMMLFAIAERLELIAERMEDLKLAIEELNPRNAPE